MLWHLKHKDIDKKKWDESINNSVNRLIYAKSWYLDIVSPGWEAIVNSDYSCIMPLPIKNKFGFRYIVQPKFTKQLGVFSNLEVSEKVVEQFLHLAALKYRYIRINLNQLLTITPGIKAYTLSYNNHELDLSKNYDVLRKNYKRRTYNNLCRAEKHNIKCSEAIDVDAFANFALKYSLYLKKNMRASFIQLLIRLMEVIKKNADALLLGAINENGELIAVSVFFIDDNRAYFIFNTSNQEGFQSQAMYLLTDCFIQQNAGKKIILDFTGSHDKGIAFFLESFGATAFQYQYYEYNNTRFPLKLFLR